MLTGSCSTLTLVVALTCVASAAAEDVAPPANAAANVRWDAAKGELTVEYHGSTILRASVAARSADGKSVAVHLPEGFRLEGAEVDGEKAEIASQKETATVRIVPSATKTVEWKMTFAR